MTPHFYPYVKEIRLGKILCKISHIQHDEMRQMCILTFCDVICVGMRKLTPRSILVILDQPGSPDRFVSGCWLWTVVWLVLFCFVHVCFVVSVFAFFFVMVAGVI